MIGKWIIRFCVKIRILRDEQEVEVWVYLLHAG